MIPGPFSYHRPATVAEYRRAIAIAKQEAVAGADR